LRSFERRLAEFRARGVAIAAISVDSNEESRRLAESQHYSFPLLSDPRAETIRAYGILHAHAGEDGRDIARPAEFLVDADGKIRWENLTETILARLHPQTVLDAVDGMGRAPREN
jgi:peroxiredoxin